MKENSSANPYLVDVMTVRQRKIYLALLALWAGSQFVFWGWWFSSEHILDPVRFAVNSIVLSFPVLTPGYLFFFLSRMKKVNPEISLPEDWRVAMVVTKAPSEPWEMVARTLRAMLRQKYPHDTWLADENPTQEVKEWCRKRGIAVSTRFGDPDYHRSSWPRRAKCKEGNLAYFYDHFGYERYDLVVQLDADHIPTAGYLEEVIRPFADPKVGYVSAPSICDTNKKVSWTARARLFAEGTMHGPLQAGYTNGWAPLCIGSHYAVRTTALKEIGGLGPELAEDHATTLMMNGYGWKGVHAHSAIAHGDGPASFADGMTQEFQWSRSLTVLLLTLTPKYWSRLSWRLRGQFLFSQLWYPLFAVMMGLSFLVPVLALLSNSPWVKVSYFSFLLYSTLVTATTLAIIIWVKKNGWLRPRNTKIISWETALFQLTRWPWVFLGVASGVVGVLLRRNFSFKITPKGERIEAVLPVRTVIPYLLLVVASCLSALVFPAADRAQGYYYFVLLNGFLYAVTAVVVVAAHQRECD